MCIYCSLRCFIKQDKPILEMCVKVIMWGLGVGGGQHLPPLSRPLDVPK